MTGIDMTRPVLYRFSSFRYFKEGEHHVNRFCKDDVILMVFDGVLRFTENGEDVEVGPGQYYIQPGNTFQAGPMSSSSPKYFYAHFIGDWVQTESALPKRGNFDYASLRHLMEQMDKLSRDDAPYILRAAKFYEILSRLYLVQPREKSIADRIGDYIAANCFNVLTLEMICDHFHFSKNHIINLFREAYGVTPVVHINNLRLQRAEYLIEFTPDPLDSIAEQCGFHNYSHFYKLFSRRNGCSPAQWRERKRSDAIV